MKRLHLFEFIDQPWFPSVLRDLQTDVLQKIMTAGPLFNPVIPVIIKTLDAAGQNRIIDLCSGASGPWAVLKPALKEAGRDVVLILTDKYPNAAFAKRMDVTADYYPAPVDAMDVPPGLKGVRTVFTGFHHFRPQEAVRVLRDAMDKGEGICVFDYAPPRLLTMLLLPLTSVVSFFQFVIISARIRPMTLPRVLWNFIIPLVPLAGVWDGLVSALRKYSAAELREITAGLESAGYAWEVTELRTVSPVVPIVCLSGYPRRTGTGALVRPEAT